MMCTVCSHDLDPTGFCDGCGRQLSVREEVRLRGLLLAPRKEIEDDKFDLALRGDA